MYLWYGVLIVIVYYQHKLAAVTLKKGTAQAFRFANSARIFVNLCCYYKYIPLTLSWKHTMHSTHTYIVVRKQTNTNGYPQMLPNG